MKEQIENVLNDDTISQENKAEEIQKVLGPLFIPKNKFNDVNNELKNVKSQYSNLNTEFEDFKKSKMTEEEKQASYLQEIENQKKENAIMKSKLGVKELFINNGFKINENDSELNETLENIVSEDYDKSIKLATNFLNILSKTKENTEKETTTNLLNKTPKPNYGGEINISNIDLYNEKLNEAIKNKDSIAQATYSRLIYEERNKQK